MSRKFTGCHLLHGMEFTAIYYAFYTDVLCLHFVFDDRGSSTITTTTTTKEEEALCLDQTLATAEG